MGEFSEYLSCDDFLLVPYYSNIGSRSVCDPGVDQYSIPLIASCMDTVYSPELDELLVSRRIMVWVHRYFKNYKEQLDHSPGESNDYRFFAVGKDREWIKGLWNAGIRHFVVDMAHGDSKVCEETVKYITGLKDTVVIAGNVTTTSGFRRLQDAGAWAVRVGIGSGSICSTRLNAGFGAPLITSVSRCSRAKNTAKLIADGGIKFPGDVPKAIRFGADMVVSGRLWAGTSKAPGDCYDINKRYLGTYKEHLKHNIDRAVFYKVYRGMSSAEARRGIKADASIEGVSGLLPYIGTTENFIHDFTKNMQSALSYGGALTWEEFRRNVKAIRITQAGWDESKTHVGDLL